MLFRSLVFGLVAAIFVMIAQSRFGSHGVDRVVIVPEAPARPVEGVHVIDVASTMAPVDLPALIPLAIGEHFTSVNDQVASDDDNGRAMIQQHGTEGGYLDITVARGGAERRFVLLFH